MNADNFEFIAQEYEEVLQRNQEVSMLIRFSNQNRHVLRKRIRDQEKADIMKGVHQLKQSGMFLDDKKLKFDFSFPFRQLRTLIKQNVHNSFHFASYFFYILYQIYDSLPNTITKVLHPRLVSIQKRHREQTPAPLTTPKPT